MGVKDTVLNKTEFNRHFKQRAWSLFVCLLLSLLKASLGHGGTSGSPSRLSIQHRVAWPQLSTDSTPLGCFHRGRWTCTKQDTCAASQPSDCYSSSGISGSLPQKSEITAQFVHMSSAGEWWTCAVCLACGKLPKKQLSTGYFDISKCFPPSLIWRVCFVSSAVCSLCTSTSCLRPQSLPVCGDKQVSPLRSSAAFRAVPALQPPGPWAELLLLPSTADRCHPRAALQWWCRKPMNKSQRERRRGGDVLQLLLPELLALLTPGSHCKAPGEDALSTGHRQAPGSCCQPPAHSHLVGWGLRVPGCRRRSCAGYGICPWGDTSSTGWTVTDQKFIYNKKKPTGN